MGATPVYAFPYQGVNDAPNGPTLGQSLAEAVEAKFVANDATVAALTASVNTADVQEAVQSTATIGLTTTAQDLTGATLTFTTTAVNRELVVTATVDGESSGTTDIGIVTCLVDGVVQAGEIHWGPTGRASYSRTWRVLLTTAAAHVIKLQGRKSGNTNNFTTYQTHTNIVASAVKV